MDTVHTQPNLSEHTVQSQTNILQDQQSQCSVARVWKKIIHVHKTDSIICAEAPAGNYVDMHLTHINIYNHKNKARCMKTQHNSQRIKEIGENTVETLH